MFAYTNVSVDVGQIILGLTALCVALGVPATVAAIATKKNTAKLTNLQETSDTGNGKAIGKTVHDIAGTLETVVAQGQTNASELVALRKQFNDHLEHANQQVATNAAVHDQLLRAAGLLKDRRGGTDGTD